MVDASCVIQEVVCVMLDPERDVSMAATEIVENRLVLWRSMLKSSRLELFMVPPGLVSNTNVLVMFMVQG